jgi:group I intron endonuclease
MSNSIYTIYKATNMVTNESYIGFDSSWPKRKEYHKAAPGRCPKFHAAIRKYGWENFEWEVLLQSRDREYSLKFAEPHLIEEHNTRQSGYNVARGGQGWGSLGTTRSKETREKISNSKKGCASNWKGVKRGPQSLEHRMKLSQANKNRPVLFRGGAHTQTD